MWRSSQRESKVLSAVLAVFVSGFSGGVLSIRRHNLSFQGSLSRPISQEHKTHHKGSTGKQDSFSQTARINSLAIYRSARHRQHPKTGQPGVNPSPNASPDLPPHASPPQATSNSLSTLVAPQPQHWQVHLKIHDHQRPDYMLASVPDPASKLAWPGPRGSTSDMERRFGSKEP